MKLDQCVIFGFTSLEIRDNPHASLPANTFHLSYSKNRIQCALFMEQCVKNIEVSRYLRKFDTDI